MQKECELILGYVKPCQACPFPCAACSLFQVNIEVSSPFYLRYVASIDRKVTTDEVYKYDLKAFTGVYSYYQGSSGFCSNKIRTLPQPANETYCDTGDFAWGTDSVLPTPFATWKISLPDPYDCIDLSNLKEIWLSISDDDEKEKRLLGDATTQNIPMISKPPG